MSCGKNSEPGGPPSATYILLPDIDALRRAFNGVIATTSVLGCPGGIQSPGPWHHTATPQQNVGMVLCGLQKGNPAVAWTNDAELLLNVARAKLAFDHDRGAVIWRHLASLPS